jgi:chromosome partitioning protein
MGTKPNGGDQPPSANCRILILGGSKGGCGRSTLAKNLLVLAGQAGIRAIGIDFDAQRTLAKWARRRAAAREKLPEVVPVEVVEGQVDQWSSLVRQISNYQLAIVDTAPGVEHDMSDMLALCREAALVLVPTSPAYDDLESIVPWVASLKRVGSHSAFVLNKANRRTKSFSSARSTLLKHGNLVPIEVPILEDIATPSSSGLAVVDFAKGKGADCMADLWRYASREVGL